MCPGTWIEYLVCNIAYRATSLLRSCLQSVLYVSLAPCGLVVQVRTSREEGSLRVRNLEESLARLGAAARAGGAGEVGVEATRLAAEADAAKRAEARALAQVEHLKVRGSDQKGNLMRSLMVCL